MKKINKTILQEHISSANFICKNTQKYILGGLEARACCYSEHWSVNTTYPCSGPSDCEGKAGPYGWWCCECEDC